MRMFANAMASLVVVAGSYVWATLVQYVFHRLFGHENRVSGLYRAHLAGHHSLYPRDSLQRPHFTRPREKIGVFFLIPMFPLVLLLGVLLPLWAVLLHVATLAFSFWIHFYLHKQYHLGPSRFDGHEWFERKRQLHFVHHIQMRSNYAIIEYSWDRLFRTLRASDIESP